MKRIFRRLGNANKVMLTFFFIILASYIIGMILVDLSVLKLAGIETTYRYIGMSLLLLYFIVYLLLGYRYTTRRKKVKFILISLLTTIIVGVMITLSVFINYFYGELSNMKENDKVIYSSYLVSFNDKIGNDDKLGMIKDEDDIEGHILAIDLINKEKLNNEIVEYNSYSELFNALQNEEVAGIFVSGNYKTLFDTDYSEIISKTKVLYKYSKEMNNKDLVITSNKSLKEPFTLLLMGVDTNSSEGVKSNSSFNGDTLMVISFNPKTLNAVVFSIPRDLYVPISCYRNSKFKINSSAAKGTSCVVETIEQLIDIDIDYYAKINFQGVVDLVNAFGGIDVDVENAFCEQDSKRDFSNQICLKVGYQHLDGEQALAFARHRHTLPTGDLMRIQNQQKIVEAIANKALTLNSISDVKDILSAISNNISLNMDTNQILSSYDILKTMVGNALNDKEILTMQKTYLEVFNNPVYDPGMGIYLSTLGYYSDSLDDITKAMRVNLELEEAEMIKTFTFDAAAPYEQKVYGKGISTGSSVR